MSPGRRPARRAAGVEKAVAEPVPSLVSESPCASHLSLGALFPRGTSVWGGGSRPGGGRPETTTPKAPTPSGHAQPGAASRADPWSWDRQEMPTVHQRGSRSPAIHTIVATDHAFIHSVTEARPPQEGQSPVWRGGRGITPHPRGAGRRVGRPPGGPSAEAGETGARAHTSGPDGHVPPAEVQASRSPAQRSPRRPSASDTDRTCSHGWLWAAPPTGWKAREGCQLDSLVISAVSLAPRIVQEALRNIC